MSDSRNVKLEIVEIKGALQKISPLHSVVKVKRWRMAALVSAMAVVVAIGFALAPDKDIKPTNTVAKTYAAANPVVSDEIIDLKGQFVGLISGSIESKLRTLENNIRVGAVSNSLGTIQDLKNDVKVLRAYSSPNTPENTPISNTLLMQEVSHLRNLIYLTLTSCGLMLVAVVGVWFKNRKRLPFKQQEAIIRYLGKH